MEPAPKPRLKPVHQAGIILGAIIALAVGLSLWSAARDQAAGPRRGDIIEPVAGPSEPEPDPSLPAPAPGAALVHTGGFHSGHYYRVTTEAVIPVQDDKGIYQAKREFAEHLVGAVQKGDELQILRTDWEWFYIAVTKANGHACDVRGYVMMDLLDGEVVDIGTD